MAFAKVISLAKYKDFILNFDEVRIEHTLNHLQSRKNYDAALLVAYQNGQDKWLEAGVDYVFRLEDLKERPTATIAALCDWMGIDEEKSLYEMTFQGKKWWGDSSSPDFKKDHMSPFGKASIERKVGEIFSDKDQFVLGTLFYPLSARFGYTEQNLEQFLDDLQTIRPMLDQLFDFEAVLMHKKQVDEKQFKVSGHFRYLRACMIDRWKVLNEFQTYPGLPQALALSDDNM